MVPCSLIPYIDPSGSADERAQAVTDIKAILRGQANKAFAWMAGYAQQLQQGIQQQQHSGTDTSKDQVNTIHQQGAKLLACFQSWVRLGSLQEISPNDCQTLIQLGLSFLEQTDSPVGRMFSQGAETLHVLGVFLHIFLVYILHGVVHDIIWRVHP